MSLEKCCTIAECFSILFFSLNSGLSQQATEPDCVVMSVFNLSTIADCRWAEGFIPCVELSPLSFNRGGGPLSFVLQHITCVQYALSEDFLCSCQMDCLLSFHGFSFGTAYAFFGAISCDVSQLDGIKAFFGQPDTNITFVSGPSPFTSCNITGQIVLLNAVFAD